MPSKVLNVSTLLLWFVKFSLQLSNLRSCTEKKYLFRSWDKTGTSKNTFCFELLLERGSLIVNSRFRVRIMIKELFVLRERSILLLNPMLGRTSACSIKGDSEDACDYSRTHVNMGFSVPLGVVASIYGSGTVCCSFLFRGRRHLTLASGSGSKSRPLQYQSSRE
jgi:hypothetical protein